MLLNGYSKASVQKYLRSHFKQVVFTTTHMLLSSILDEYAAIHFPNVFPFKLVLRQLINTSLDLTRSSVMMISEPFSNFYFERLFFGHVTYKFGYDVSTSTSERSMHLISNLNLFLKRSSNSISVSSLGCFLIPKTRMPLRLVYCCRSSKSDLIFRFSFTSDFLF